MNEKINEWMTEWMSDRIEYQESYKLIILFEGWRKEVRKLTAGD